VPVRTASFSEGARYLGRSKVCGDCSKFTAKLS
jgi:hypothetical protein